MYDIGLYGHLVFDKVIDNTTYYTTGGIANVYRSLKNINKKLSIHLSPVNIGTSIITINRKKSERYCNSKLNIFNISPIVKKSKINHVAYINEIHDSSFINNLDNIISVDLCSGKQYDKIHNIDYLFISEEDLNLLKNTNNIKNIISHCPHKSYSNNAIYYLSKDKIIKNINVLGAGDCFAAHYLYGLLEQMNEYECIKFAHEETTKYLLRNRK